MTYPTIAGLGLVLAATLIVGPVGAQAQGLEQSTEGTAPDRGGQTRTFGTPTVSHTLQAFAFTGFSQASSAALEANSAGSRFCSISPCFFVAALQLPAGALVTGLELTACDTTAAGNVTATLHRVVSPESSFTTLATAATGGAATPGCAFPFTPLATPHEIENFTGSYFVQVRIDGASVNARFQAVRVLYTLAGQPGPRPRDVQRRPHEPPVLPVHPGPGRGRNHQRVQRRSAPLLPGCRHHARSDGRLPQSGAGAAVRPVTRRVSLTSPGRPRTITAQGAPSASPWGGPRPNTTHHLASLYPPSHRDRRAARQ